MNNRLHGTTKNPIGVDQRNSGRFHLVFVVNRKTAAGEAVFAYFPKRFYIDWPTAVRNFRDLLKEHGDTVNWEMCSIWSLLKDISVESGLVGVFFEQVSELPNCCGKIYLEKIRKRSDNCLTHCRFAIKKQKDESDRCFCGRLLGDRSFCHRLLDLFVRCKLAVINR